MRASAAAAVANMLSEADFDENEFDEEAETTRDEASASKGKHYAKTTEHIGKEVSGEMLVDDVEVDILNLSKDSEEASSVSRSGMTARDFIAHLVKKVDAQANMKDDSNLIDQRGEQTDHLHSDTAEKKETTCVFTAQEVVQLNDMLSVKHVQRT